MRVLTIGSFDLFHYGHLRLLNRCKALSDDVCVGVNSDSFILAYKGRLPIMDEHDRLRMIRELGFQAILNESDGKECIEDVEPDLVVIGSDWAERDYLEQIGVTQDWLDNRGISIMYVPRTDGISSSIIKERCKQLL